MHQAVSSEKLWGTGRPRVLAFNLVVSIMAGLISGLVPAIIISRTHPSAALILQPNRAAGRTRLGRFVIIIQLALSLPLLAWAGLMTQSLHGLITVNPGFIIHGLAFLSVSTSKTLDERMNSNLIDNAMDGLRNLPGVGKVGFINQLPWDGIMGGSFYLPGQMTADNSRMAECRSVEDGFFQALGVPILAGRPFSRSDGKGATRVAIVNQSFARNFLKGRDPIGQTIVLLPDMNATIIAICPDFRLVDIRDPATPMIFLNFRQETPEQIGFLVRTDLPIDLLRLQVCKVFQHAGPSNPIVSISTAEGKKGLCLRKERVLAALAIFLAIGVTLLSAVGLYGLVAFDVGRRRPEFGIRMALGALPRSIYSLVWMELAPYVGSGILIGFAISCCINRLITGFLYGVSPLDPFVLAMASFSFVFISFFATLGTIRKAAKTNPVDVLRTE